MKIKLIRSYRSKKGNTTFVYGVTGTPEQLKAFEKAQGEFHVVDETTGTPLWFTTRCVGQTGSLIITTNNKVIADMSAFDQADSLAKQYGGNLGTELAKRAAEQLLGNGTSSAPAPARVETTSAEVVIESAEVEASPAKVEAEDISKL